LRRLFALALTLLAAVATTAQAAPLAVPYTRFVLPNGLTVIIHEDHSIPRVHTTLRFETGSSREVPGRTGFAHLFEHLMFEGSKHVPEGSFDRWLSAVGGENNAYTAQDATVYYEEVPSNALELPLFLESDRLAYFVDQLKPDIVDGQRDVVKNERRQSYENRPYAKAQLLLPSLLYPQGHPYSWPVIGSMEDLSAASVDDVKEFYRLWYRPSNATLVIAGDVDTERARALVEKWFSDVPSREAPPPPATPAPVRLTGETRAYVEDAVELPKLIIAWPTVPAFHPADASLDLLADVLADGMNSRLYKKLVYELQVAQTVNAYQQSLSLGGYFTVEVTARPGNKLDKLLKLVDEEIDRLVRDGVTEREIERAQNGIETSFYDALQNIGAKADHLAFYSARAGDPDYFEEDLSRYRASAPSDVQEAAARWLTKGRVVLSVVPTGKTDLAPASSKPAGEGEVVR
jgi:zinc protease